MAMANGAGILGSMQDFVLSNISAYEQFKGRMAKDVSLSMAAVVDPGEFSRIMIECYVTLSSEAVRKVDPHI